MMYMYIVITVDVQSIDVDSQVFGDHVERVHTDEAVTHVSTEDVRQFKKLQCC